MTHDDYQQLTCESPLEPCPVCGSQGSLWQYSTSFTAPTKKVIMCVNADQIGPRDGVINQGCLLYMPPHDFYRDTIREAVSYWNQFSIALRTTRDLRVGLPPPTMSEQQAIECLWRHLTKDNPAPIDDRWRKVLATTYDWAVQAIMECSRR